MARTSGSKAKWVPAQEISIVDLILMDHRYLKQCVSVLTDEDADPRKKYSHAKGFLDALRKHSEAEKKSLYAALVREDDFRPKILEGYVEHEIVDRKVKSLTPKVRRSKHLTDQLLAELKVLAELVQHHVREEESEVLPQVKNKIDEELLLDLGAEFMKLRHFTKKDLSDFPQLGTELQSWKENILAMSNKFVTKMDKYVESLRS